MAMIEYQVQVGAVCKKKSDTYVMVELFLSLGNGHKKRKHLHFWLNKVFSCLCPSFFSWRPDKSKWDFDFSVIYSRLSLAAVWVRRINFSGKYLYAFTSLPEMRLLRVDDRTNTGGIGGVRVSLSYKVNLRQETASLLRSLSLHQRPTGKKLASISHCSSLSSPQNERRNLQHFNIHVWMQWSAIYRQKKSTKREWTEKIRRVNQVEHCAVCCWCFIYSKMYWRTKQKKEEQHERREGAVESQENEAKKCIKIQKILKQSLLLTVAVFFFHFHSHSHSIHSDKVHLRSASLSLLPFLFNILKVFVEFIWFPFWLYLPIVESTLTILSWAAAKTERERE